jgi:hypothetical protein
MILGDFVPIVGVLVPVGIKVGNFDLLGQFLSDVPMRKIY